MEDISKVRGLFRAMLSADKYDVRRTHINLHTIPVLEETWPIKQRPYRYGPVQEE